MIEQNITVKGLRLDDFFADVEKTNWTYALNQVYGDEYPKLSTEPGNELCVELPYNNWYGTLLLERGQEVVFIGDGTTSEIGLIEDCTYTTLIRSTGLGFQDKIITPGFKIINGCERVIWFNDFINPDRYINLDKLEQYTDETSTDLANQNDTWNVDEFSLSNTEVSIPQINTLTVNDTGGSLELGQYHFAIETLDESLNSIYVGPISGAVAIYDERLSEQYDQIDGGSNIAYDSSGVPPTNKSITLTIDNLDTNYPFYRIYVLKRVQGFTEVQRIDQEFPSGVTRYTYRGTTNVIREDVEKLTITPVNYEQSRHITQVDRKLVRANLKEKSRDWAAYQQKANLINTAWISKQVEPFSTRAVGNSKNPNTYFFNSSFQGDEVYAMGIVYYHTDGTTSPVFHIPGKSKSGYDGDTLTVVATPTSNLNINVAEVRHLGYKVGDTLERWEVYNTAQSNGRMSYYEADTSYPDTLDCNGDRIYPTGKIRHHKLPDRSLLPVYEMVGDDPKLNLLGLEFNNVEYPATDIVGHQFVMVPRDQFNSTVLDYGFFVPYNTVASNDYDPDEAYQFEDVKYGSPYSQTDNVIGYLSPDTILGNLNLGSNFTIIGYLEDTEDRREEDTENFNISGNNGDIRIYTSFNSYLIDQESVYLNRSYDQAILASPRSTESALFDKDIVNAGHSNNLSVYNLLDTQSENEKLVLAVNKQFIKPYENLFSLQYKPITPILTGEDNHEVYSGDIFLCDFKFLNITQYTDLLASNDYGVFSQYNNSLWVECKFNYDLIHGDRYVPHPNEATVADTFVRDYIITKVADVNPDDNEYIPRTTVTPEEYLYNEDYDILYSPKSFFSLPVTYDYCSECPNYYPNRIIWSLNSLLDENVDAFRIFLNEDYTIVGDGTGQITGLHYDKNRMLVRTMQSMFQLAPNPQVINTDIDTAYLGTGDFLSIPPNELVKTNYGYAGGQGKWDMMSTEYGVITIDQKTRQVFLFTNNLKELSSKQYGAQTWFRENLNSECELSYDPRHKRVLISNDDWTLSYSPEYDTFVSFHSYIKNMYHTYDRLHWVVGGSVWKQADRNFCNFFGIDTESKIEFVVSNRVTSDLDCIEYYAQTLEYNDGIWIDKDEPTFSKFLVYTQQQSTGEQTLISKPLYAQPWSNTEKVVVHAEQNYRICQIRDLATNVPVSRKAGIEILPNDDNLDFDRDQRKLIPLKDKWFKVKFTFKPQATYKLIFDIVQSQIRNSQL